MFDFSKIAGFDWDSGNVSKSAIKHGVSCEESESVFMDALILADTAHSTAEETRWHAFGLSKAGRALSVTFTVREDRIRVISSRPMNSRERKTYGFNQK